MSVRMQICPPSAMSPIAMPATAFFTGTPAAIIERLPLHTEAIELEPLDSRISETWRTT